MGTQCGGSPLEHNINQSLSPSASMSPTYPSTPNSPSGFETPSFTPHPPVEVDAQTESNHDTALTIACAGGYDDVVHMLLEKNASIEHRDKKGNVLQLYFFRCKLSLVNYRSVVRVSFRCWETFLGSEIG